MTGLQKLSSVHDQDQCILFKNLNKTHIGKLQTSITPNQNDVGFLETELQGTPSNSILWMVHYHREPALIWANRASTMIASSLQNSLG